MKDQIKGLWVRSSGDARAGEQRAEGRNAVGWTDPLPGLAWKAGLGIPGPAQARCTLKAILQTAFRGLFINY